MNPAAVGHLSQGLLEWVGRTSLHGTVLIVLVLLTQLLFGRVLPARWRYAPWLLVVLRLLMPVAPASSMSIFNLGNRVLPGPRSAMWSSREIRPAAPQSASHEPERRASVPQEGVGGEDREGAELEYGAPSAGWMGGGPLQAEGELGRDDRAHLPAQQQAPHVIFFGTAAAVVWWSGFVFSWLVVWRQHWRFSRRVGRQSAVSDARVHSLLEQCKLMMSVRRPIRVVVALNPGTPALFGFCRPRLVLPEGILQKLDERELRMVFLHELAHVKRADILLNWTIILVRSLHWFNPLVWLAMRRLRAERELVCDAMVLERLAAEERRIYGGTLVKLLDEFSGAGFCPSLAPVINHKNEIKRRIIMIAEFKPAGRVGLLLTAAIVVALCCLTFTRAAERRPAPRPSAPTAQQTASNAESGQAFEASRIAALEAMRRKFDQLEMRVGKAQDRVDQLRKKFTTLDGAPDGRSGFWTMEHERVRSLEEQRVRVEAEYQGPAELLNGLLELKKEKGYAELRKSMLTAVPDEVLAKLIMDLSATEANLAMLRETMGPEHPEFRSKAALQAALDAKINQRIDGILVGLNVKVNAFKANRDSLTRLVGDLRKKEAEIAENNRPFFDAKRDLESLQTVRDALYLKMLEQEYGVEVPKAKPEEK